MLLNEADQRLLAEASAQLDRKEEDLRERAMLRHVAKEGRLEVLAGWLRSDPRPEVFFDVLAEVGVSALRPSPWDHGDDEGYDSVLWPLMWARIDRWYREARKGTLDERRDAAALLQRLGAALAGDRRGKKAKPAAVPVQVYVTYRCNLLRLDAARKLAKRLTTRRVESRIAPLAEACRISADLVERSLARRPTAQGGHRWCETSKSLARIVTAREHGITEPTVSNLLRRFRPEKAQARKGRTLP